MIVSPVELLGSRPELFEQSYQPRLSKLWAECVKLAITHTRGVKPVHLLDKNRPNEEDVIKAYRLDNYQPITKQGTFAVIDAYTDVITGSNYGFKNVSDSLKEWLDSKPLYVDGKSASLFEYFCKVVVPLMLEDPNALLVAFPLNSENNQEAPMRMQGTEAPTVEAKVVLSHQRVASSKHFLLWRDELPMQYGKKGQKAPHFWFINSIGYFHIVPVGKDRKGIDYKVEPWYFFNVPRQTEAGLVPMPNEDYVVSPVNVLGGTLTYAVQSKDGKYLRGYNAQQMQKAVSSETYNTSIIEPYFVWSDLTVTAFNDDQGVRVRFNYPRMATVGQPCPNERCKGGWIGGFDDVLNRPKKHKCGTCKGTGYAQDGGVYHTVYLDKKDVRGADAIKVPIMQFFHPPVEILQQSWDTWERFSVLANKSVGMDILAGEGLNESGEAKKVRLKEHSTRLNRFKEILFDCMEVFLAHVEQIVEWDEAKRQMPKISRPVRLNVYTTQDLLDTLDAQPASNRLNAELEIINTKYRGDEMMKKIMSTLLYYAPWKLLKAEEINLQAARMTPADVVLYQTRSNYGQFALQEIAKKLGERFLSTEIFDLMEMADTYLEEKGLLPKPPQILKPGTGLPPIEEEEDDEPAGAAGG